VKTERIPNFTPEFLQAFSAKIGIPVGAGLVPAQKEKATIWRNFKRCLGIPDRSLSGDGEIS
jgi:hypothetical protein